MRDLADEKRGRLIEALVAPHHLMCQAVYIAIHTEGPLIFRYRTLRSVEGGHSTKENGYDAIVACYQCSGELRLGYDELGYDKLDELLDKATTLEELLELVAPEVPHAEGCQALAIT